MIQYVSHSLRLHFAANQIYPITILEKAETLVVRPAGVGAPLPPPTVTHDVTQKCVIPGPVRVVKAWGTEEIVAVRAKIAKTPSVTG